MLKMLYDVPKYITKSAANSATTTLCSTSETKSNIVTININVNVINGSI